MLDVVLDEAFATNRRLYFCFSEPGAGGNSTALVGALKFQYVARIVFENGRMVREEKMDIGQRVRDVRQAADGSVYAITDARDGRILKLLP